MNCGGGDVVSNASIGSPALVSVLMELDPLSVYRKARQVVSRYPETLPAVTELVRSYNQAFDDMNDDHIFLEGIHR